MEPVTTFNQVRDIADLLMNAGIRNILITMKNWNEEDIRGKIIRNVRPLGILGGRMEMTALATYLSDAGIPFVPSVDFIHVSATGHPFLNLFKSVKNMGGTPAVQPEYVLSTGRIDGTGRKYLLLSPQNISEQIGDFIDSYRTLEIDGIALEAFGSTLYDDFAPRNKTSRNVVQEDFERTARDISESIGLVVYEKANSYVFPYADVVLDAPLYSSMHDLFDETVPFLQMVMSGRIDYAGIALNTSDDPETLFLKSLETGASLRYEWIFEDHTVLRNTSLEGLCSAEYAIWLDDSIAKTEALAEIYSKVEDRTIHEHRKLMDGVYEVIFEDGSSIMVNYRSEGVFIDGRGEVAARGYRFMESGGRD